MIKTMIKIQKLEIVSLVYFSLVMSVVAVGEDVQKLRTVDSANTRAATGNFSNFSSQESHIKKTCEQANSIFSARREINSAINVSNSQIKPLQDQLNENRKSTMSLIMSHKLSFVEPMAQHAFIEVITSKRPIDLLKLAILVPKSKEAAEAGERGIIAAMQNGQSHEKIVQATKAFFTLHHSYIYQKGLTDYYFAFFASLLPNSNVPPPPVPPSPAESLNQIKTKYLAFFNRDSEFNRTLRTGEELSNKLDALKKEFTKFPDIPTNLVPLCGVLGIKVDSALITQENNKNDLATNLPAED